MFVTMPPTYTFYVRDPVPKWRIWQFQVVWDVPQCRPPNSYWRFESNKFLWKVDQRRL